MSEFRCEACGKFFQNRDDLKAHNRKCVRAVFKKGPSFKGGPTKKQVKIRRQIKGTYEWALAQSNGNTPKRLKKLLMEKPPAVLEKEILRLEIQVAFNDAPEEQVINRLIAFSHAYVSVNDRVKSLSLSKNTKQTKEEVRKAKERARRKAVKEMHAKLKPDVEKTGDIMDIYFKSGERAVTSGGLPSLGKRK